MQRIGQLWDKTISLDNLYTAFYKAAKGKRNRKDVQWFALNREEELLTLHRQLIQESYRPGEYRQFTIYERKPRVISVAPFRDRVVHHAIMNHLEPLLDKRFIYDSYACRKNKGVHKAIERYQYFAGRFNYVLKLDIRQYFPSIDHDILKQQLQRHIKDKALLCLLSLIIDSSVPYTNTPIYYPEDDLLTPLERRTGLPIGNLTSQVLANLYLNSIDHWIKEELKIKGYIRYVDDLCLFTQDKENLWQAVSRLSDKLSELRLSLHHRKRLLSPASVKQDFLGYQLSASKRWLRNDNGYRFARKLQNYALAYRQNKVTLNDLQPSVTSWIGHSRHGETLKLREKLFNSVLFQKS